MQATFARFSIRLFGIEEIDTFWCLVLELMSLEVVYAWEAISTVFPNIGKIFLVKEKTVSLYEMVAIVYRRTQWLGGRYG